MSVSIIQAAAAFRAPGKVIDAIPYGSGHINDTYLVTFESKTGQTALIFQKINSRVFRKPDLLMENISRVTSHMEQYYKKIENPENDYSRRYLRLIPTRNEQFCYIDEENNYWRAYNFIDHATTYDIVANKYQAFEAARAFAIFQKRLVNLPGERLHETIPDFHNTPGRIKSLHEAIKDDSEGRVRMAADEIDFLLQREVEGSKIITLMAEGKLPERITHNDTKLNNVMIDNESGEGICVIDLDTVMPGSVLYDFGDMVRTSTSPAAEDETDISKVTMQMNMFEALVKGYLSEASDFLTPLENELLPFSGKLITLNIGVRFLTDFLSGDIYFKTHRENHNLERCRTQIALIKSIEKQFEEMIEVVEKESAHHKINSNGRRTGSLNLQV